MADYLGHTNDKVRSIAEETFGNLPIYRLTDKEFCYRALIMPSKREKPPKVVIGRLKMLTRIIKENQLGKNYEAVIKYAVKYSDDKSN